MVSLLLCTRIQSKSCWYSKFLLFVMFVCLFVFFLDMLYRDISTMVHRIRDKKQVVSTAIVHRLQYLSLIIHPKHLSRSLSLLLSLRFFFCVSTLLWKSICISDSVYDFIILSAIHTKLYVIIWRHYVYSPFVCFALYFRCLWCMLL